MEGGITLNCTVSLSKIVTLSNDKMRYLTNVLTELIIIYLCFVKYR